MLLTSLTILSLYSVWFYTESTGGVQKSAVVNIFRLATAGFRWSQVLRYVLEFYLSFYTAILKF